MRGAAGVVWLVVCARLASAALPKQGETVDTARLAAFNIQVFGQSKMDEPAVVSALVHILGHFDLTAVQEIRDSDQTALPELVDALNSDATATERGAFEYVVGPRLGRTTSKEQYALVYRPSVLTVVEHYTFDDDAADDFEREPLVALMRMAAVDGGTVEFALIVLHAKPGSSITYLELDKLVDVHQDATERFGTDNAILMGDFNADCSYLPNYRREEVRLWTMTSVYTWLIDGLDTTTAASHCCYDRIVIAGDDMANVYREGSAGVYDFETVLGITADEAEDVSDHFPVFLELDGGGSTNSSPPAGSLGAVIACALASCALRLLLSL